MFSCTDSRRRQSARLSRFFSFRMPDADTTIVAHFIAYDPDMEFKLTLQSSDESKEGARGSGEYPAGEYVGIEAAANRL